MALVPCQVLRVAILLSYCSILCNYKAIEMPSHQTYGGSWKFLTFIDLGRWGTNGGGHSQVVGYLEENTDLLLRGDTERVST
ncbi:androgen-induced gene 1 protein isoform X10 [Halichoerus grypus]|uniref:androgen-induced gene 1 protein isoform X6 n=1 Tax=Phoca vitulina TaxID=9720 RepID=UPI001395DC5C|nr:androgen-induced gene 1 protein isoform X6 [Phoca vitulina]XP_035962594.1 androgen-induced gene 1 protein isoform X19 [Halichoerus grypus]